MILVEGRNLAFSMLCIATPSVGLLFFNIQIYIALLEKFEQPGFVESTAQILLLSCYLNINLHQLFI